MERIARPVLDFSTANRIAEHALTSIQREYPNSLERFFKGQSPRTIHPAFYGCYDWHSAVHNHWTLVRLLKTFPDLPTAPAIRTALDTHLTADNLRAEITSFGQPDQATPDNRAFSQPGQPAFERPYGWAWLLQLAAELETWDDPDAYKWSENLKPLTKKIVGLFLDLLRESSPPVREGQHKNTAFGLSLAFDYARVSGHSELEKLIIRYALDHYASDPNYPAQNEPGPTDFFSPALTEADFMQRVLAPAAFADWFDRFLPELAAGQPAALLHPVIVADHNDPFVSHLDGLNLSRAWSMYKVAARLPEQAKNRQILRQAADRHAQEGLAHLFTGNFSSTGHWLATFAVYLTLSEA